MGGFLCRAAVVAREIGVPAVFGVRDATRRLQSGEVVRVDGDGGEILLLNRPA
jgi:pyruvate,water dikinase